MKTTKIIKKFKPKLFPNTEKSKLLESIYGHVEQGGWFISISDDNQAGPKIDVEYNHFVHKTKISFYTDEESLRQLGFAFLRASNKKFSRKIQDWSKTKWSPKINQDEEKIEIVHSFNEEEINQNIDLLKRELIRLEKIKKQLK